MIKVRDPVSECCARGLTWREWVRMWCWNRCIPETTLDWTGLDLPVWLSLCLSPTLSSRLLVMYIFRVFLLTSHTDLYIPLSLKPSVFCLTKDRPCFLHPPLRFPQCCFCFFLAVQTNICFVRVTSHIPNHRESCSQRQQTGAVAEIQPGQAYIKRG